jgi:hypothetical protein
MSEGMLKPKYAATSGQTQSNVGINPFAVTLIAESFADDPARFGDQTVMVIGHTHSGKPVYMLLSTRMPTVEQFNTWPEE